MGTNREQWVESPVAPEEQARAREAKEKRFRYEAAAFRRRAEITHEVAGLIMPPGGAWTIPPDALKKLRAIGRGLMEPTAPQRGEDRHG